MLSPQLAQWLQRHGYPCDDLEAVAEHGMTPLMRASKSGDTGGVFELLQAGAALDATKHRRQQRAVAGLRGREPGSPEHADPRRHRHEPSERQRRHLLMYAASTGKHAVVEALLVAGANPQLMTLDGFSALDMAASIECLRLLRSEEKGRLETVE